MSDFTLVTFSQLLAKRQLKRLMKVAGGRVAGSAYVIMSLWSIAVIGTGRPDCQLYD